MLSASDPNGLGGCGYFARRVTSDTHPPPRDMVWRRCRSHHANLEGPQRPKRCRRRLQRGARRNDVINQQNPPENLPPTKKHRAVETLSPGAPGLGPVPWRTSQHRSTGSAKTFGHRSSQELSLVIPPLSFAFCAGRRPGDDVSPPRLHQACHTLREPGDHCPAIAVFEAPQKKSSVILVGQQRRNHPTRPGHQLRPTVITGGLANCPTHHAPPHQEHAVRSTRGVLQRYAESDALTDASNSRQGFAHLLRSRCSVNPRPTTGGCPGR